MLAGLERRGEAILSTAWLKVLARQTGHRPQTLLTPSRTAQAYLGGGRGRVVVVVTTPPPLRRPLEEGERWSAEITVWLCLLFWWPGVHLYRWDRTVAMGEIIVPRGVVPLEDTSFGTKALMASVILEDFCLHVCVCVFRHQTLAVLYEKEADHDLSHGLKLIPPMLVANGESRP